MLIKREKMISKVMRRLNEPRAIPVFDQEDFSCMDAYPIVECGYEEIGLRESIDEIIGAVSLKVISECDVGMLGTGKLLPCLEEECDDAVRHIDLPEDYLRLRCFRLEGWERSVERESRVGDRDYHLIRSRYEGLRGNEERPAVALVSSPFGMRLEFADPDNRRVVESRYIPHPESAPDGMLDLPEPLVEIIAGVAADEVRDILGT